MSNVQTIEHDLILPAETGDYVPVVRTIGFDDLKTALRKGFDDFKAMPTHALFIGVIYPVIGLLLARAALGYDLVPLIYPLASGFALIGPFAALGLYELSRRREMGRDTSWRHMLDFMHLPTTGSILALGGLLVIVFLVWISAADALYTSSFGHRSVTSVPVFLQNMFGTPEGRGLIVTGNLIGLLFAATAFVLSAISFPLLLDRNVSLPVAMATSVSVVMKNPVAMAVWGLVVALGLLVGALPALLGLVIVVPVLGHATWHLYRSVLEPAPDSRPEHKPRPKYKRYGAQFPASLFVASRDRDD